MNPTATQSTTIASASGRIGLWCSAACVLLAPLLMTALVQAAGGGAGFLRAIGHDDPTPCIVVFEQAALAFEFAGLDLLDRGLHVPWPAVRFIQQALALTGKTHRISFLQLNQQALVMKLGCLAVATAPLWCVVFQLSSDRHPVQHRAGPKIDELLVSQVGVRHHHQTRCLSNDLSAPVALQLSFRQ